MKYIDLEQWERKGHYQFFSSMDVPYFSMTFDVDVTKAIAYAKQHSCKIFSLLLYFSMQVANEIPELKTRIRDDQVVEHDSIDPGFTIMGDSGMFNFCYASFNNDSRQFFANVDTNTAERKKATSLVVESVGRDDVVYVTSVPWVKFTNLQHPMNTVCSDSIPRLAWGRFTESGNALVMPYNIQLHHGLADGAHIGKFYEAFQERLNEPDAFIR
ncbi:MAG: chloramphenicol acetyltransferase [Desulfovibrionales bacterium]|nr:chloramphenicol acetyltransferase [Desulfovibrionales bacterium]